MPSDPKFTPGSWHRMEDAGPGMLIYAVHDDVTDIARVLNESEADEATPNSDLIAAAPDMYKALNKIATAIANGEATGGVGVYAHLYFAAIHALAKARGEHDHDD